MKQSNFLDDEDTTSLYSASLLITFPQLQKHFLSVLSKIISQVPLRMYKKSSQRNSAKHKKTSLNEVSKRSSIAFFNKNHLEAKKGNSDTRKMFTTHEIFTPPVINQMSSYGAVCSRPCFSVQQQQQQQELEYSSSYKTGTSKVSGWKKIPHSKLIRSKRQKTKSCLLKQTLWLTKFCLLHVSSSQIHKL